MVGGGHGQCAEQAGAALIPEHVAGVAEWGDSGGAVLLPEPLRLFDEVRMAGHAICGRVSRDGLRLAVFSCHVLLLNI